MNGPNEGETFCCERCKGTFTAAVSDAEAIMEYHETFTEAERSEAAPPALVCDSCYRTMMGIEVKQ